MPCPQQEAAGDGAAIAALAVHRDRLIALQVRQLGGKAVQRPEKSTIDVARLPLGGIADVDQIDDLGRYELREAGRRDRLNHASKITDAAMVGKGSAQAEVAWIRFRDATSASMSS